MKSISDLPIYNDLILYSNAKAFFRQRKTAPVCDRSRKIFGSLERDRPFLTCRYIITCPISYFITKVLQTHQMLIKLWFSFIYVSLSAKRKRILCFCPYLPCGSRRTCPSLRLYPSPCHPLRPAISARAYPPCPRTLPRCPRLFRL